MSTIDTQRLIEQLSSGAAPVDRLPAPWIRVTFWLTFVAVNLIAFVLIMSPRRDLGVALSDPTFIVEQLAALATGVTAALAAFASVVPGFDRRTLLLPLLPLAVWLGSVGSGCTASWIRFGSAGLTLTPDWACVPAIALIGLAPAAIIAFMLRRGAAFTPRLTAALGGLAAAGLGSFGLRLCHAQDASLMILVWQIGAVALLTAAAAAAGRWVLGSRILAQRGR
jgi:hypothetical protein